MFSSNLAAPLPPDVVVHASWFGRARQFPIFSRAWFRYRSAAFLSGLVTAALVLAAMAAIPLQPARVDWPDVLQVGAVYGLPCVLLVLAGPALAVWVHVRGWSMPRECAGILCVLLLGMAASVAVFFQLKDLYEAARVDPAGGGRVMHLLPRPQITVRWAGGITIDAIDPHAQWFTMMPAEKQAFDAVQRAQAALARVAPDDGDAPLTPQETAAMTDYLHRMAAATPLSPAQEASTRAGRAAYEKLLRYQAAFAAWPKRSRGAPHSAAYEAALATYGQAVNAFTQVLSKHASAAGAAPSAGAQAALTAADSAAGRGAAVFLLIAIAMLVGWLGGLTDLVAYVRQRGKLDDVLRDQALRRAGAARLEAELRLSVLAAQVEPHFLFNTLASVRSAIASDPVRAAALVDHLADYLRSTIPQMRGDAAGGSVALERQLDAARAYLALMHERMPRLTFAVDAEPGLETALVPPLMLISLVENAVKHGAEPKAGPTHVTVSAARVTEADATLLELRVRDDGVGFGGATSGAGVGLANIQERLAGLYGPQAGLTLKALPDGGVEAILRLPLTFPAAA